MKRALKELLGADQRYTTQIAEIIRRDPSLTSRLLHLVNSVYYGLANPIKNIEEAVFFLGVRQIRQLAMVTPVIEDFQKLTSDQRFPWRQFWRHCIGVALITRELVDLVKSPDGESDYVSGSIHDVGKIVMSSVFPDHFQAIYYPRQESGAPLDGDGAGNPGHGPRRTGRPLPQKTAPAGRFRGSRAAPSRSRNRPRATPKRWRRCRWPT